MVDLDNLAKRQRHRPSFFQFAAVKLPSPEAALPVFPQISSHHRRPNQRLQQSASPITDHAGPLPRLPASFNQYSHLSAGRCALVSPILSQPCVGLNSC